MPELVLMILIFLAAGLTVLASNLVLGRLVRPNKPSPEKGEVYECGEKPIGTAWVQFDVRFYVVALLFVIFDVELAFFFPWAVVFGSATRAGDETQPVEQRVEAVRSLQPTPASAAAVTAAKIDTRGLQKLAWIAFLDILVFFGVLLVGFAYLWRRGDLKWVRSVAAETSSEPGMRNAERKN
jgi:NADH-quinone oxidoreductase subunit A